MNDSTSILLVVGKKNLTFESCYDRAADFAILRDKTVSGRKKCLGRLFLSLGEGIASSRNHTYLINDSESILLVVGERNLTFESCYDRAAAF